MTLDQLPARVREFANYLDGLLARLDQGAGWCGVFWQRDPDGMQACLDGREIPPWDVVEALLQDLATEYGPAVAASEADRARPLHAAALVAHDARPGGRDALGDRFDVMLREQRYAAERQAELGRFLASATTQQEADAIRLDLAWARDDHERATRRCAELRARMDDLDRRSVGGQAEEIRRGRTSQGATVFRLDDGDTGAEERGGRGGYGSPSAGRDGYGTSSDGRGAYGADSGGRDEYAARSDGRDEHAPRSVGRDGYGTSSGGRGARGALSDGRDEHAPRSDGRDGYGSSSGGRGARGALSDGRDEYAARSVGRDGYGSSSGGRGARGALSDGRDEYAARSDGRDGYGSSSGGRGAQGTGSRDAYRDEYAASSDGRHAYGAPSDGRDPYGTRPDGRHEYTEPTDPRNTYAESSDGRDAPYGAGFPRMPQQRHAPDASATAADSEYAEFDRRPATPEQPAPAPQEQPAPTSKQRKRRRGSARFAGVDEEGAAPVVVPPAVVPDLPVAPVATRRTLRGARYAGAAETDARPEPQTAEPSDAAAARRESAGAVERLVRLRGEGRSGEAHALLAEIAYWPAVRYPLLAAEMQRAGLGADWATLLWETASLPPDRLVAVSDALVAAGRGNDGEQVLRQGVVRPAGEIGQAVLALVTEGHRREARALLDAYVRVRSAEEAARSVEPDPQTLAPLLLEAARGASDELHRDLVHALRVAGHTA
ncbi:hypothetical protein OG252_11750 [Streptomyces sp. NBC_01352]|uniref:hypothetical protein n=1 Tax=unclassified Streptomyces TaxID=2593676 RepID=UPI002257B150|nr:MULTISPECIES: hypothetical protein [unclassified Streptomyces]MCX4704641.1 hypothetical protein [Streptomyces sp. NBC_01373]